MSAGGPLPRRDELVRRARTLGYRALLGPLATLLALPNAVLAAELPAGSASGAVPLRFTGPNERLLEFDFSPPSLRRSARVRVLLPRGYASEPDRRYPVLLLLHGGDDDYTSWTRKGGALEATADLPLIVVMPDAGNGFYADWRAGPQWETFHLRELLPWVDATFRTVAARRGRAVLGLSMGGFGALSYAARHPDLFVAAGSFSGYLDTNRTPSVPLLVSSWDRGTFGSVWGRRLTQELRWRAANPTDLAPNLRHTALTVHTGTGRPGELDAATGTDIVESLVHGCARSFLGRLDALGIDADRWEYDGTHLWPYWARSLRATLPRLMAIFDDPPPDPVPFSYLSADPGYRVYGWEVRLTRPVPEFSRLRDVRPGGFELVGSGTAAVRTAAWYEPGREYRATVEGPTGHEVRTVQADGDGRLHLHLELGPGNRYPQYGVRAGWRRSRFGTARVQVDTAR